MFEINLFTKTLEYALPFQVLHIQNQYIFEVKMLLPPAYQLRLEECESLLLQL